jgi:hypothetical protein
MAIYMMQFSAMQFGTFLLGALAAIVGARIAFGMLGAGLVAVALGVALMSTRLRRLA